MTKIDLDYFRDALRIKHVELAPRSRTREHIVIERSPDTLEEVAFKSAREIAVVQLHRESVIRRDVGLALKRLDDQTFGECKHCGGEISLRGRNQPAEARSRAMGSVLHPLPRVRRPRGRKRTCKH